MSIREVIATVNQMEKDGVIERYAIGGAVGATFYLEPVATLDVDVFVTFAPTTTGLLSLSAIFEYLVARGGVIEKEYVVIHDFPVQILPATNSLVEEALANAIERDVDGVVARVFTPEHLAAIALQVGRSKDKLRIAQFLEDNAINITQFESIVSRHGLASKWLDFKKAFLDS